jgi:hypothetical protein
MTCLLVDFAPVCNARYIDRLGGVVDFVHGPVITDANPPFAIPAFELLAARRPGNRRQGFQTRHNAGDHFSR